ncbi:uncharacterized protein PpBr36_10640 [Pyricularia pennisetigena]|uniref:uncharacterized protein n=1 Tax=Pyricularia pennisetigena TaxID=1578925 RepID=UPI001153D3FE|nr:uncharacterized protein PpBr36_10640 [Pyricularia pennisetigena]TLS21205.1 hypothetical protein PpBr36_10640 [Pyricularia pennisetigena]
MSPNTTFRIPREQTVILQASGGVLQVTPSQRLPETGPHQLLVKTLAVTLNPCDWKTPIKFPTEGSWCGCDFTGTVVSLGTNVERFQVGDMVFGACKGSSLTNLQSGAFAEYLAADADYTFHTPEGMGAAQAAAMCGTAIATLATAFYTLGPIPGEIGAPEKLDSVESVLVYGGSSSVGLMAIQLIKLMGHEVVTTCSPHNFDLVKSYGADAVFDYHSPTCAEDIKTYTRNRLRMAIDPFGEVRTLSISQTAIGRAGGRYVAFEKYDTSLCVRKTVNHTLVMAAAVDGLGVDMPEPYGREPDPKLRQWTMSFYQRLDELVSQGKLQPCPVQMLQGGWEGIIKGLDLLRQRAVSGRKLVALIP